MLHRVEMNVVKVILQIIFVANDVLPKARLPDSSTPTRSSRLGDGFLMAT